MISVVMASYNGERYIGEQLKSILSQLAPDDEVVVSDDGSSDRTVEIVEAFRDPRIRLLPQNSRLGYVANFERAVRASRGEVIFFSDQDDVWLPTKVDRLVESLKNSVCVASDATVVNERLQIIHSSYFKWRKVSKFSFFHMYVRPAIIGATLACRRAFLESVLPFPAGVPHDFWMALHAARRNQLAVIAEPLILYRRHPGILSNSASERRRTLSSIAMERLLIAIALVKKSIFHDAVSKARSN